MSIKIAFYSPKGGSGKSTGIAQVAGYLALKGETIMKKQIRMLQGQEVNEEEMPIEGAKVLIIDADPSFNATQNFYQIPNKPIIYYPQLMYWSKTLNKKISKEDIMKAIAPAYTEEAINIGSPEVRKAKANIFIAPSRKDVYDRQILTLDRMIATDESYNTYDKFFSPIYSEFDYILIDCPGQITGSSHISALSMAQYVVTPSETDIYSSNALLETKLIIKEVRDQLKKELSMIGFYYSRINSQRGLDRESKIFAMEEPDYLRCAIKNAAIIPQLQGTKELVAFNKEAQRALRERDIITGEMNTVDSFELLTNEIIKRIIVKMVEKRNLDKI